MAHPLHDPILTLNKTLRRIRFAEPVSCTYNPLEYALDAHLQYLERFGNGKKRAVFLGMNPGPYGMVQTGVPFGEIPAVRDWMGIECPVGQPKTVHPKRPVEGFACAKSEVSGRRFWGMMAQRYSKPQAFFKDHFVLNFCPLVWMGETGKNITPDKIARDQMTAVYKACDGFLRTCIELYEPKIIVGVGAFAEKQATRLFGDTDIKIGRMLHPSPASPLANKHWPERAIDDLVQLGVWSS